MPRASRRRSRLRNLILVLGDQLDLGAAVLERGGFDPAMDAVWMAEVEEESTHVRCHPLRIAAFLSAMRHFRDALRKRGFQVHYTELPRRRSDDRGSDFATVLRKDLRRLRPEALRITQPGDYRVLEALRGQAERSGVPLEELPDRHFYCGLEEFESWAEGRKRLVLETFYRAMRRKHGVLVDEDGEPEGGRWNLDQANREAFPGDGPGSLHAPRRFRPDPITNEVRALVAHRFSDHPGNSAHFDLPVTARQARALLSDFVEHRLPDFGRFEDAMWEGESFLYHSRLSFALNLKLLDPRACVDAAVEAYRAGRAPLNSVEGFVRQILGWREFVRGIYWRFMPDYATRNALGCDDRDVPAFYWDGETDMRCLADAMRNVLDHAYAHHIQRLMVLGLFAQLVGVHPIRFHDWHMALYADAVDWVSLPNTLGMSQYGDGGVVGTKPYCATGKYIQRMSNHCAQCRYDPAAATGEEACPFTSLYWDFLAGHRGIFAGNPRMSLQLRSLDRKADLGEIRERARTLRARITKGARV